MTTIFYDGKNLHADRRQIIPTYPARYNDAAVKLFVNETNTIAYGSTGDAPTEKQKRKIFEALEKLFELVYSGVLDGSMRMEGAPVPPALESLELIAITRHKAILIQNDSIFIQTSHSGAVGTGARSLIAIQYVLGDVAKSYEINATIDTLSSVEHTSIWAEALSPYVVE